MHAVVVVVVDVVVVVVEVLVEVLLVAEVVKVLLATGVTEWCVRAQAET